jgi:hypothetical protein
VAFFRNILMRFPSPNLILFLNRTLEQHGGVDKSLLPSAFKHNNHLGGSSRRQHQDYCRMQSPHQVMLTKNNPMKSKTSLNLRLLHDTKIFYQYLFFSTPIDFALFFGVRNSHLFFFSGLFLDQKKRRTLHSVYYVRCAI